MTIVTIPNDYRRETGAERIARFNAQNAERDRMPDNSFFCPVCSMGRCRVVLESQNLPFEEWLYECGHCNVRDTKAGIHARLNCRMCGRTLNEWGRCPRGCNDNAVTLAIIETYSKPEPVIKQRCRTCGNHIDVCECEIVPMDAEHIRNGQA